MLLSHQSGSVGEQVTFPLIVSVGFNLWIDPLFFNVAVWPVVGAVVIVGICKLVFVAVRQFVLSRTKVSTRLRLTLSCNFTNQ